jgi:hypothetical protein
MESNFKEQDIKTFINLFWGRQDAYGVETAGGPITKREPLTQDHYLSHFKGTERIGIFPIFPNNEGFQIRSI